MATSKGKWTNNAVKEWTFKDGSLLRGGVLTGFMLEAHKSGRKSYSIEYSNKYGKRRRMSLGQYGELTLNQARVEAERLLHKIRHEGYDPLEQRLGDREALDVDALLDAYLAS